MKIIFGLVAIIQTILHYLGILGLALGVIALLFGNNNRGFELLIGGIMLIAIKYIVGFAFVLVSKIHTKDSQ